MPASSPPSSHNGLTPVSSPSQTPQPQACSIPPPQALRAPAHCPCPVNHSPAATQRPPETHAACPKPRVTQTQDPSTAHQKDLTAAQDLNSLQLATHQSAAPNSYPAHPFTLVSEHHL